MKWMRTQKNKLNRARKYMIKPSGTAPKRSTRWTADTITFLTQDEMRRILDAIDSKRDYAIPLLAYRPARGSAWRGHGG
jgi:hypothetical protein